MTALPQFEGKVVSKVTCEKLRDATLSVEITFSDGSTLSAENGDYGIVLLVGELRNEVLIETII